MSDDDLSSSLGHSVERRVRKLSPRPDLDDLLSRVGERATRRRRWFAAVAVIAVVTAGIGGYLLGTTKEDSVTRTIAVQSEGLPGPEAASSDLEPADVEAARAAVVQSFHDAYTGGIADSVRAAAIQHGDALEGVRRDAVAFAQQYGGYTSEQLAGTTVTVLGVSFIDDTHAAVRFTITVPGHGDVLVDRVGYAVFDSGRWKVALRTACDLLSLNGLLRSCPPR